MSAVPHNLHVFLPSLPIFFWQYYCQGGWVDNVSEGGQGLEGRQRRRQINGVRSNLKSRQRCQMVAAGGVRGNEPERLKCFNKVGLTSWVCLFFQQMLRCKHFRSYKCEQSLLQTLPKNILPVRTWNASSSWNWLKVRLTCASRRER